MLWFVRYKSGTIFISGKEFVVVGVAIYGLWLCLWQNKNLLRLDN